MNKNAIACCSFPTTVMFVDDRQQYLDSLRNSLPTNLSYLTYSDPTKAIKFIHEHHKAIPYIQKWTSNLKDIPIELGKKLEEQELTHSYIDIDIAAIHQEVYAPKRFSELSVVVVDYAMPEMNGLEFCRQLQDSPIKKLMLTGQADYAFGVDALNDDIIDRFMAKGDLSSPNELNLAVQRLQYQYFCDLSAASIQSLTTSPFCCLADPIFINFFNDFRAEHKIAEYYLVNDTGCFLFLDSRGNPSWLVVKSERDLDRFYHSLSENNGPADMIEDLENHRKLIFLFTEEDETVDKVAEWRPFMYPATELVGHNNNYYYTYIEGTSKYDIDVDRIVSYNTFLQQSPMV